MKPNDEMLMYCL